MSRANRMQLAERVQQQLARLNPKDRRALGIVTAFLTVVFAYVGLLEPLLNRADQANTALLEFEDQQRRYTRQVMMLPRREAKLDEYRAELAALKRYFELAATEPEAAVAKTIVELTYYARLAAVAVGAIRPLDASTAAEYLEVPLEIEADADFEALRKFFYYIDSSPSLLAITDLQLTHQNEGLLKAQLKLSNIGLAKDQGAAPVANLMPRDNRLLLAISRWTGYATLVVAKHNGYLESESMQVNLLLTDDKVTINRLLVSGDADGIGVSLPELLAYWVDGIPLQIVLPLDSTAGTEGIAVLPDSEVRTLADLRQRRIAVEPRGILKFVLSRALQSSGLKLQDVQLQELDASQVARELASGTLEVGLTREPYLSSLVERGQARLLYTSEKLEGLIIDLLAMTPKALNEKQEVVQFLVDGLLKARQFIADQPERAMEIVAEWENQPIEVTRRNLAKISLYDADQIRDFFDEKRLAEQLATFEAYLESIAQPLPLVTAGDIAAPIFVRQALNIKQPENHLATNPAESRPAQPAEEPAERPTVRPALPSTAPPAVPVTTPPAERDAVSAAMSPAAQPADQPAVEGGRER